MTIGTARPTADLEHKSAPTMLAPRPSRPVSSRAGLSGVTEVGGTGEVVALVAVPGIEDDVHDVIEPGASALRCGKGRCSAYSGTIGNARSCRP